MIKDRNGGYSANTTKSPQLIEITLGKYTKPEHKSAARMLGYVLTLGTNSAWWQFATLVGIRLSHEERAALAFMTLNALDNDDAIIVADTALGRFPRSKVD
ncbi:hypothetical protein [Litoreibacter janthinus]|uniref:Uncharacterized protein n=1 Tax=Litoreibacter janthinus TaxID=670154 RepID=A0A1I6FS42_9RHOB|nr:hypothetical protein [Litoreibacter janthinus]SFR32726.1 hypothetical protein SAMN04488002_0189 [Litoreibacter janthinus]